MCAGIAHLWQLNHGQETAKWKPLAIIMNERSMSVINTDSEQQHDCCSGEISAVEM